MIHRNTIRCLLLAGLLIQLESCSLKEDRSDCPCWLDVFFTKMPPKGLTLWADAQDNVFTEKVSAQSGEFREYTVPRTIVTVCATGMIGDVMPKNGMVLIEKGFQADSLYAHSSLVDCRQEFAKDTVTLHKQFATVYMTFVNTEQLKWSYRLHLIGNVCGMNIGTLAPLKGEFSFWPQETSPYNYQFRIPRQADPSLQLELYRDDSEEPDDILELGRIIENAGFDWKAEDLKDVVVKIDFAKVEIDVKVTQWEPEAIYEITI